MDETLLRESFLHELILLQKEKVYVTFLADSGRTGRTLTGTFVACDTNLSHILVNDLITPVGSQSCALLRLNDVVAISKTSISTEKGSCS